MTTPELNAASKSGNSISYNFHSKLQEHGLLLTPISIETLQVNVTRLCNQECTHCRLDASPKRTEQMERGTVDRCLEILAQIDSIGTVDITGGAPELNRHFEYLVAEARKMDRKVIVRHNLTVTFDGNPQTGEGKAYLPGFFAAQRVEVIASLPHYEEPCVNDQRGSRVFEKSIRSLQYLNALGYGREGTGLILNLVHNPVGLALPADQKTLEEEFKRELLSRHSVEFNSLYTMTNVPLKRFKDQLRRSGVYDDYMKILVSAFNPAVAAKVMCRSILSIGYDGKLYDCDINQALNMQIAAGEPMTVFNFDLHALMDRRIRFAPHCFACTAAAGSS
jgi:radical SAM/Cys-rich protein